MKLSVMVSLLAGLAGATCQAGQLDFKVLDKEGKPLPDAVLVLYPRTAGSAPTVPSVPTIIQQEKMRFLPAVTVVPAGSNVRFTNLDRWDHHVRGTAESQGAASSPPGAATNFEFRISGKADGKPPSSADIRLDKPGTVLLGCHLHGSMRGDIFVTDSAWTLKTDADGNAHFDHVPEGAAELRVWHAEDFLEQPRQILQITAAPMRPVIQLNLVPRRRRI